jgi:hypothetical protein
VVLCAGERKALKTRARRAKTAHQDWLRAQIVLAAAGWATRRGSLALGTRPGNVIDGDADTEHTVATGPAIDAAAVIVADLHLLPGPINGRHQVQVDRPGDARKNDVADFELRRIYRSDDTYLTGARAKPT